MGIGGSITLLSTPKEDPIVTGWANRVTIAGGTVSMSTRIAHDEFVKGLKLDGLWAKMRSGLMMPFASDSWAGALVPLVAPPGSTFTPILLTASDYSFAGGVDPGAGNLDPKRIETNINAQSIFGAESAQVSVYRPIHRLGRDSVANTINGFDVRERLQFHASWENNETDFDAFDYDQNSGRIKVPGFVPVGFLTGTRLNGTLNLYKNGVTQVTSGSSLSPVPNANINLLGCFVSDFAFYSRSTSAYLYLGLALTPSEELLHYERVQSLQTALGRQV